MIQISTEARNTKSMTTVELSDHDSERATILEGSQSKKQREALIRG
jgi:hypothetical protein